MKQKYYNMAELVAKALDKAGFFNEGEWTRLEEVEEAELLMKKNSEEVIEILANLILEK